jgi:hypothetical protein
LKNYKSVFLFLLFIGLLSAGKNYCQSTVTNKPVMNAVKIDKPIELTGKLDNPIWAIASPVEINYEVTPGDNTPAPQRTVVRALYDDKYLYFGFQCFDTNPEQIRANITERDNMFQDDYVIVCIDTYGDFQRYYELAVNPFGIKGDLMASSGGNEDGSFDMMWEAAASKNESGWTAVMAIPFSSLNFSSADEQTWVLGIIRTIPRESRTQVSWTRMDRNIPGLITQAGLLKGLKNIKSGGGIELLPYIMGQKSGFINDFNNPNAGIQYDPIMGRFGGGIKYSPSPNFTLDAVINPDFSQIESDADQISVNTTFALQYDEKRPFFLARRELLQTPMYYSRSINDPLYAGRITGKSGSLTYLYMGAYDRNTVFVIPGEESSSTIPTSMKSFANIGRARYDFGDENYIGGMIFTRNMEGGANYLFGLDWKHKFWTNWSFAGEVFLSQTNELNNTELFGSQRKFGNTGYTAAFDGESYSGSGIHLSLSHDQRSVGFGITYNDFSPTFQTYNGAFTQVGYRQLYLSQYYTLYQVNSFIDRAQLNLSSNISFNREGARKELYIQPGLFFMLKGQTQVNVSYNLVNEERFFNKDLKEVTRILFNVNSRPLREISIYLNGEIGNFIYRSSNPVVGEGHNLSATLQLKPTSQLDISLSFTRANLHSKETDQIFFDGDIYRGVAIYQFSSEMLFRTILQYNSFDKIFQLYPLFSYKLNPFTTFFAGATSNYFNYEGEFGFKNIDQQYFIKLQYLLGI